MNWQLNKNHCYYHVSRCKVIMISINVMSRVVAALLGGYVLAAVFSVAALALPVAPSEAVLLGMLGSFLLYAGAAVWVFAVRSAARAWAGLGVAALILLPAAAWVWLGEGA